MANVQPVMSRLAAEGARVAIASNQAGVSLGILSEATARELLVDCFRASTGSDPADWQIQMCAHGTNAGCDCRKPEPGMLTAAMTGAGASPAQTLFVGDMESDRLAAQAAGCDFAWADDFFGRKAEGQMNAENQNAGGTGLRGSGAAAGAVDGAGSPALTVIAYDVETLRAVYPGAERALPGMQYVPDWSDASKRQMGVACCGVENIETGEARIFTENLLPVGVDGQFRDLYKLLAVEADLLISFGGGDTTDPGFDNVVLAGAGIEIDPAKCLDIRLAIKRATGDSLPKGLTLGKLAQANADPEFPSLGRGKTGDGGLAPERWARGQYQEVIDYCLNGDVKMTADLWRKHQRDGYLLLPDGGKVTLALPELPPASAREIAPATRAPFVAPKSGAKPIAPRITPAIAPELPPAQATESAEDSLFGEAGQFRLELEFFDRADGVFVKLRERARFTLDGTRPSWVLGVFRCGKLTQKQFAALKNKTLPPGVREALTQGDIAYEVLETIFKRPGKGATRAARAAGKRFRANRAE